MPYYKDFGNEIYFYEDGNSIPSEKKLILITEHELHQILASKDAERAPEEIRIRRDGLLKETDEIVIRCMEAGEPVPKAWKAYRQALRDIPQQPDFPEAVVWPEKPEGVAEPDGAVMQAVAAEGMAGMEDVAVPQAA